MLALSHFQQAGAPPSWLLSPVDRTLIVFDGFLALWYFKKLQDIWFMFCPRLWIRKPGKRCSSPQLGARVTAAPELVQKKSLDFPLRTYTSFSFPRVCRWQLHSVMEWRQKPRSQPWVSLSFTHISILSANLLVSSSKHTQTLTTSYSWCHHSLVYHLSPGLHSRLMTGFSVSPCCLHGS